MSKRTDLLIDSVSVIKGGSLYRECPCCFFCTSSSFSVSLTLSKIRGSSPLSFRSALPQNLFLFPPGNLSCRKPPPSPSPEPPHAPSLFPAPSPKPPPHPPRTSPCTLPRTSPCTLPRTSSRTPTFPPLTSKEAPPKPLRIHFLFHFPPLDRRQMFLFRHRELPLAFLSTHSRFLPRAPHHYQIQEIGGDKFQKNPRLPGEILNSILS